MTTRGQSGSDQELPGPGIAVKPRSTRLGEVLSTKANEQKESLGQNEKLMEQVADPANLNAAWKRVRENGGAPGIDGITVEAFLEHAKPHAEALRRELLEGSYGPSPLRRVTIPKPAGGERKLSIPAIQDRVVQMASFLILEPIFEADLQSEQYAYRAQRSALDAVHKVHRWLNQGMREIVDADLRGFAGYPLSPE